MGGGGQLGLEIAIWTGTDAPAWKHTRRTEWNTDRAGKRGVEDTRAIHNARTSAEIRPTDKFDGKCRGKKAMEKRDCTKKGTSFARCLGSLCLRLCFQTRRNMEC